MHIHYQRRRRISCMCKWRCEQGIDAPIIYTRTTDALTWRKRKGRFRERIQMGETLPGDFALAMLLHLAHLTEPDIAWMLLVEVSGGKTTQIRCCREMWPASIHRKIISQCIDCSIAFTQNADLLRQTIPRGKE